MKQNYRLTESELHNIISECIQEAIEDEGFMNQAITGAKTFFGAGNNGKGLKDRFQSAKKNYNLQGQYDDLNSLLGKLKQYVADREIDPQMTVGQLIGGEYNKGKFGKMTGQSYNIQNRMKRNGLG